MLKSYSEFFDSLGSGGCTLEFADFSQADMSEVQVPDLQKPCAVISDHYTKHGVTHARCASWIPRDINCSPMEIYSFLSKMSPEVTRVFGTRKEAFTWLLEGIDLDHEVALRAEAC